MEEKKQDIIQIGEQDEIIEIIDKIRQVPEKTVTLLIPKNAVVLQDVTNLKILQKKTEEIGKEISISKTGVSDLYQTELPKPQANFAASKLQNSHTSDIMPKARKISDMVRKGETVDLRQINLDRQKKENEKTIPTLVAATPIAQYAKDTAPFIRIGETVVRAAEKKPEEKPQEDSFAHLQEEKQEIPSALAQDFSLPKEELVNKEVRRINREDLFEDNKPSDPTNGVGNKFDFSYGYNRKKKKKHSILPTISAKVFTAFILVCIITASFSLFFILPKADIAVALKQENVKGNFSFILDKDISEVDESADKIPAKTNEISSEKTQTFSATSKKQLTTKATGELIILNECSTGEQVLVAGTRFLSKDGSKIFKIESNAIIPGFTKPEDAIVPGAKTVKVTAEEAGEAYNVGATTFTIPKLQELVSWKYSCLYARSDKPMSGGSNKEVNYISQSDYDKAKETLTNTVKTENAAKVSQQQTDEVVYINDQGDEGEISIKSAAKVNDIADQFEMTASIKKSILTVDKKDLETVLAQKIKEQNSSQSAKPVEGSLNYEIGDIVDKDKEVSLNISASEGFIFEPDQNEVRKEIAGKNKQQLNDYFAQMNGVKSVSVNLWPFWVNKVPNSFDKINISLDISDSV